MKGARRYFGLAETPAKSSFDQKGDERSHEQAASEARAQAFIGLRWLLQLLVHRGESRGPHR